MLRARGLHAFSETKVYLLNQIISPILGAKLVPTCQFVGHVIRAIKLGITYAAETLVIRAESSIDVWEFLGNARVILNAYFKFKLMFLSLIHISEPTRPY